MPTTPEAENEDDDADYVRDAENEDKDADHVRDEEMDEGEDEDADYVRDQDVDDDIANEDVDCVRDDKAFVIRGCSLQSRGEVREVLCSGGHSKLGKY